MTYEPRVSVRLSEDQLKAMKSGGYASKSDFIRTAIDYMLREAALDANADARGYKRVKVIFSRNDVEGIVLLAEQEKKSPKQIVMDAVADYIPRHQEETKAYLQKIVDKLATRRSEMMIAVVPEVIEKLVKDINKTDSKGIVREISLLERIEDKKDQ